jgi:spoIIIJ-associated protein
VEVTVLSAPAKGFFGIFGARAAKVRVVRKAETAVKTAAAVPKGQAAPGRAAIAGTGAGTGAGAGGAAPGKAGPGEDKVAAFIKDVAGLMALEAEIKKTEDEEAVRYALSGPQMGILIGRRGDTLDALQYLANIVAGKEREEPRKRVVLDAEDYRKRREETLVRLANRLAAKAKRSGRRVVLEPMSPVERRVIHTALQNDPQVKTLSEGDEPYRRLVIYPVDADTRERDSGRYDRNERFARSGGRYGDRREDSRYRVRTEVESPAGQED